jgi:quercetin dioxygenase-like cupin family protein
MVKTKKVKQMVDYQQDSIVSRVIVDRETGTITLFAFDVGQGLSEHTAPYDAMVYLVQGEGRITIGGEHFALKEGEMIIMPAHIPHAIEALVRFKMLLVMMRS